MKNRTNQWLAVLLCASLSGVAYAELGETLFKVNAAISIVTKARAIQKKFQGPDTAPIPIQAPTPNPGGSAEYVSPFRADGEPTTWALTGMKASLAGAAGAAAGANAAQIAGSQVASKIPFGATVVGLFGNKAKEKAQETSVAVMMGGWDEIRATSDYSFANLDDLAVFMHANHVEHPDYPKALAATMALYPELQQRYEPAVEAAVKLAYANPPPAPPAAPPAPALAQASPAGILPAESSTAPGSAEAMPSADMPAPPPAAPTMAWQAETQIVEPEAMEPAATPEATSESPAVQPPPVLAGLQASTAASEAPANPAPTPTMQESAPAMPANPTAPLPAMPANPAAQTLLQEAAQVRMAEQVMPGHRNLPRQIVLHGSTGSTIEQHLNALVQRRVRGELSGDEYLALRNRLIYGR